MNALVIYDSQYGNTERIAQTIADALHESARVRLVHVDPAQPTALDDVDLLIIGCPTQGWNATPAIRSCLDQVSSERLHELAVACFDTRFHKPRWLTGSAAQVLDKKLREMGVAPLVAPESFFVQGSEGPLQEGELDRAASWARALYEKSEALRAPVR